eukprot:SAG11_NODE_3597_length_2347_cov_3.269573_3_plen_77_part_00
MMQQKTRGRSTDPTKTTRADGRVCGPLLLGCGGECDVNEGTLRVEVAWERMLVLLWWRVPQRGALSWGLAGAGGPD